MDYDDLVKEEARKQKERKRKNRENRLKNINEEKKHDHQHDDNNDEKKEKDNDNNIEKKEKKSFFGISSLKNTMGNNKIAFIIIGIMVIIGILLGAGYFLGWFTPFNKKNNKVVTNGITEQQQVITNTIANEIQNEEKQIARNNEISKLQYEMEETKKMLHNINLEGLKNEREFNKLYQPQAMDPLESDGLAEVERFGALDTAFVLPEMNETKREQMQARQKMLSNKKMELQSRLKNISERLSNINY